MGSDGQTLLYAYQPDGSVLAAEKVIGSASNDGIYYPLLDELGSVRHLTDDGGSIVASFTYDVYGNVRHSDNANNVPLTLGYTGARTNADGTLFMQARFYQPELGRFLQRDDYPGRLGRPQSLNRYAYTEGNPANYVDTSGFYTVTPDGDGGGKMSSGTVEIEGGSATLNAKGNTNTGVFGADAGLTRPDGSNVKVNTELNNQKGEAKLEVESTSANKRLKMKAGVYGTRENGSKAAAEATYIPTGRKVVETTTTEDTFDVKGLKVTTKEEYTDMNCGAYCEGKLSGSGGTEGVTAGVNASCTAATNAQEMEVRFGLFKVKYRQENTLGKVEGSLSGTAGKEGVGGEFSVGATGVASKNEAEVCFAGRCVKGHVTGNLGVSGSGKLGASVKDGIYGEVKIPLVGVGGSVGSLDEQTGGISPTVHIVK